MAASENDEKEQKTQIFLLLNLIGEEGVDIFNTFNVDIAATTLKDVLELFDGYCNPRKNEVFERYTFRSRNQGESEAWTRI